MKANDMKDELQKMIDAADDRLDKNVVPPSNAVPELMMEPRFTMDFRKLHKKCDGEAKKMIKNATGFMLSDDTVKNNPYMKNKMQVDVVSLSSMLYQLKVNEMMQETLMEEVRAGATHNRNFEVFGQLSKTIGELNKQLLQTVEAIKSTYKDIRFDVKEKENELRAIGPGQNGMIRNDRGLVALGTKELIRETKKLKSPNMGAIQDVEEIPVEIILLPLDPSILAETIPTFIEMPLTTL
jgi:hypothetical protein